MYLYRFRSPMAGPGSLFSFSATQPKQLKYNSRRNHARRPAFRIQNQYFPQKNGLLGLESPSGYIWIYDNFSRYVKAGAGD
jgi:hypothetical protein